MAALEKLAIRGIRSFSPDEEQTIEFYSPLTMIVGQNGSGKTTIIECLKYASTGKLPTGGAAASAGQAWVHDPKLTDEPEVKAYVKLRFKARDEQRMVVVRSLQLQYKGKSKNPTFKQLEGVIKTINPITKKSESLGHKCTDLNAFIPQATGISSAILESVVFCHQEESSWPLQDGATLKKKFDDIFESTRYTKALEAIEKCRKTKNEEFKNFRISLAGLTENRDAALVIRRELEAKTQEIQEIHDKQQQIDERIVAYLRNKEEAEKALRELEAIANQFQQKTMIIEERGRSLEVNKNSLGEQMRESDEELRQRLESFSKDQENVQRDLQKLRNKEASLKKGIESYRAEIQKLTGQKGEFRARMDQLKGLYQERNTEIVSLCEKYSLPLPRTLSAQGRSNLSVEVPDVELKRFLYDLQGKRGAFQEELRKFRDEKNLAIDAKRTEVIELEAKIRANDSLKKAKQKEMKEIERKFIVATNELHGQTAVPASVLETLKAEVNRAKEEYETTSKSGRDNTLEDKIKQLQNEIRALDDEVNASSNTYDSLRENARERTLYENQEKEYKIKQAELQESITQFNAEPLYREILDRDVEVSLDNLQSAVTKIRNNLLIHHDTEMASNKERLMDAQKKLTEVRTNILRDRKELEEKTREITELERRGGGPAKFRELCDEIQQDSGTAFDENNLGETLARLDQTYEKRNRKLINLEQVEKVATNLIKEMVESKQEGDEHYTCMCCGTLLDKEGLERAKEKLSARKSNAEKMEVFRSSLEHIQRVRKGLSLYTECKKKAEPLDRKLDDIKERVSKAEEDMATLKDNIVNSEEVIREQEEKREKLMHMLKLLEKHKTSSEDLYKAQVTLDQQKRRLQGYADGEGGTLEEVEEKLKSLRTAQSTKRRQLDDTRAYQTKFQRKLLQQADLVREAEAQLEEKKRTMARSLELEKEKEILKERQAACQQDINKAINDEIPLRQEQKRVDEEFNSMKEKLEAEDGERQRSRIECAQRLNTYETLQRRVKEAEAEGYADRMISLDQQEARIEQDIAGCEGQIQDLIPQIGDFQRNLSNKDRTRRQIEDNLAYRRLKADKEREEQQLAELSKQLEDAQDQGQLINAVKTADRQWRDSREEKARNEARVDTLAKVQNEMIVKLRSEKYHQIDKKYRETKIKSDTTQMAVDDLVKYHKALDRALMQFHKMKIEEINKIIRELWTRTYQGNDIEEIALVSGEDDGGRATRSYNYRVVMKKGKTLLDMRGRCSAGQRVLASTIICLALAETFCFCINCYGVLASIVIRLALAETFCINCGVMTLDEPTTNLDHDNKGGLARAIARLIAERSRQQNFQLVVITHDEDFVDMVKQELSTQTGFSMPEYYWRISRREPTDHGTPYSKIDQVEWGGI